MAESRTQKSLLNAKVDALFFTISFVLSFFSRKVYLTYLGADFIGLAGTLQNILGFLNLAELGIGVAVSYTLYKPLQQNNQLEINQIVSVFGYMYRKIGMIIMGCAIFISLFLPFFFKDAGFSFGIIYFGFYSYLISTLISYFCNYRSVLLSADQKNYMVNVYFQTGGIIKTLIQIYIACRYESYYSWIAFDFVYGGVCCYLLNRKIQRVYPWLNASVRNGRKYIHNYPDILRRTKQVFIHKFKDFFLGQSDQILIYAFVSLSMVAYYGNYTLIVSRSTAAMVIVLSSVNAGVGNLIAENNREKIMGVFWELISIRYFIAGMLMFGLYHFLQPFICLWLGEEYLLPRGVFIMLLALNYIMVTRNAVDVYNAGYGHYADTWAAWLEGGINISISLIGGYFFGLYGLLVGKLVSLFVAVIIWKPLYLFRDGFQEKYSTYWRGVARYIFINVVSLLGASCLFNIFVDHNLLFSGYIPFFCLSGALIAGFTVMQFVIMYTLSPAFRAFVARFIRVKAWSIKIIKSKE